MSAESITSRSRKLNVSDNPVSRKAQVLSRNRTPSPKQMRKSSAGKVPPSEEIKGNADKQQARKTSLRELWKIAGEHSTSQLEPKSANVPPIDQRSKPKSPGSENEEM